MGECALGAGVMLVEGVCACGDGHYVALGAIVHLAIEVYAVVCGICPRHAIALEALCREVYVVVTHARAEVVTIILAIEVLGEGILAGIFGLVDRLILVVVEETATG